MSRLIDKIKMGYFPDDFLVESPTAKCNGIGKKKRKKKLKTLLRTLAWTNKKGYVTILGMYVGRDTAKASKSVRWEMKWK